MGYATQNNGDNSGSALAFAPILFIILKNCEHTPQQEAGRHGKTGARSRPGGRLSQDLIARQAANVGADKDSEKRQREAILSFAKRAGYVVLDEFNDAAVSGADPIESRRGFRDMLKRIEGNGVRTILVETASRFARDLMVQEVGFSMLRERGIELIAADSPHSFIEDTPTARLIRQVLGAVAEFDKAMTVAKLRGARERMRQTGVKVEGRKRIAEWKTKEGVAVGAKIVAEARRLRRRSPKTGQQRSLREISAELARLGYLNSRGQPFSASSIKSMVEA